MRGWAKQVKEILCSISLMCFGSSLSASFAQETSNSNDIYATGWGMTLALDGTGFYNQIADMVLQQSGDSGDYMILPYQRAKTAFTMNKGSCLFPSSILHLKRGGEIVNEADYLESPPLLTVRSYIFARHDGTAPKGPSDLAGAMVGHPLGSALPDLLKGSGAKFLASTNETDKALLLVSGRVDYISATLPDVAFVFDHIGSPLPKHDPGFELYNAGIGIVCHRTPGNENRINRIRDALSQKAGALKQLFETVGLDTDQYLPAVN